MRRSSACITRSSPAERSAVPASSWVRSRSPVIRPSRFCSVISCFSSTPTSRPSRITVARSLMRISSAMRWVTMITVAPWSRSSRILAKSRSVESRSRAAEDSSRMSTSGFMSSARPMVIPLLDGERQSAGVHLRVDRESGQLLHQRPGGLELLRARPRLGEEVVRTHEEVVGHRAGIGDQDLLVHGRDPGAARLQWSARRVAEDGELPGIGQDHSRHHLGESRLSRSRSRRRWRGSRRAGH